MESVASGSTSGLGVLLGLDPRTTTDWTIPALIVRPRCLCGKARYATEGEARRAVKRMRARGRDRSFEGLLHPYMCPERKGIWHVGHTDE